MTYADGTPELIVTDASWEFQSVTTDANGNFSGSWLVDPDDLDQAFLLTADCIHPVDANDTTPHLHAEANFTDGAAVNVTFATHQGGTSDLPANQTVNVNYSGTNGGGNPISGTVTFPSPGPSSGGSGIIGAQ